MALFSMQNNLLRPSEVLFSTVGFLRSEGADVIKTSTLKSLISMEFFLFFLRKNSQLHALLEPPRLFIFGEKSHLHDY